MGLSPRVRGSLVTLVDAEPFGGSIPACAGKPYVIVPVLRTWWVYPRVCGEANQAKKNIP